MTRPSPRGVALLGVAVVTYLGARTVGTWELYLVAFAFVAAVAVAWFTVWAAARRLDVERVVTPAQPVAGDPLEVAFRVRNSSWLPGLQVTLTGAAAGLGGDDRPVEIESLGSRSARTATSGPWPARRGVHHLPAPTVVAEDPLGLVRTTRRLGSELDLTVSPRLVHLTSCTLSTGEGARRGGDRRRRATRDTSEFWGIRPHVPGEPLNRVDWKATAKTGSLMLRETEDASSGEVAVLLNGPPPGVDARRPAPGPSVATGAAPPEMDDVFEVAVQAAGSLADHALRAGHAVALLLPEHGWRPLRLAPDARSHRRLLEILAGASPRGLAQLSSSLRTIVAGDRGLARMSSLTLVVLALDPGLVRALLALRAEGLHVAVVQVSGDRDAVVAEGRGGAGRTARPRDGRPGAVGNADGVAARLSLAAAGVPCLVLAPGDDLQAALSDRTDGLRRRAR